ncbi:MAG: NAD(P)-dependent oxidoreductase [Sulfuricurvum sp.]|jgi:UDP-glucose 4-epimerase|nr:NAD(P)-dependent oxidoreductase [Sulfuricurvum sp.]
MRVLVTGAHGFVGRYLIEEIINMGWGVVTPHVDVSDNFEFWLDPRVTKDIDAVVHLAALLMIDGHQPKDYFMTNALGTFNALEFARKNNIRKFIYAMTHSDTNKSYTVYIREESSQEFGTNSFEKNAIPFIASKIAAANMVDAYTRQGVLHGVNLRLANIRGFGSKDTKFNSPFHQFIAKAKKAKDIEVWGNPPKTVRDMIYVKDVVSAIIKAIQAPGAEGWYNIGSGKGLSILQEIEDIVSVFSPVGKSSKIIMCTDKEEVRKKSCIFLIGKAKKELGWEPAYSYREGLIDMRKYMERGN